MKPSAFPEDLSPHSLGAIWRPALFERGYTPLSDTLPFDASCPLVPESFPCNTVKNIPETGQRPHPKAQK